MIKNKIKRHVDAYLRMTIVPLDVVIQILKKAYEENPGSNAKVKETVAGQLVKVTGVRLNTFATKGCTCSSCGLNATHFAIETPAFNKGDPTWHLNLWGIKDGEEVLFTHDHTVARADGGSDNLSNTTTMCSPCNSIKSLQEINARKL